jgi:hypothetical protein
MRVLALVITGLLFSAAALPAAAQCPYKDQVAQSQIHKAPGADKGSADSQSRG